MNGSAAREVKRIVTEKSACDFYHVMEYPDGFVPKAQWDLRRNVDDYLGRVHFAGKRVLEVGPASGFLSLHMERHGADVTCIEPPIEQLWDFVPRADADLARIKQQFAAHIERIRNSFWYTHQAFGLRGRLFEADAYRLDDSLGTFDVGLLGSVLLHTSSPVRMIESVAGRIEHTLIICERFPSGLGDLPICALIPTRENHVFETWWQFTPRFFVQYLAVLGFPHVTVHRHQQYYTGDNAWIDMFTVVASRTRSG